MTFNPMTVSRFDGNFARGAGRDAGPTVMEDQSPVEIERCYPNAALVDTTKATSAPTKAIAGDTLQSDSLEDMKVEDGTSVVFPKHKTAGIVENTPPTTWTPYAHQIEAIRRGRDGNLALFHEPGCGKTFSALKIISHHIGWQQTILGLSERILPSPPQKALVVCPLSIIEAAWLSDCRKFTPHLKAVSLHGKGAKILDNPMDPSDIHVINFEGVRTQWDALLKQQYHVIVVDESSKMKNHDSQTTKALLALAGVKSRSKFRSDWTIPHRYILSGTPAPNSLDEYWAQMNFIAPGQCFQNNFYGFRGRFFESATGYAPGGRKFNKYTFRESKRREFMDSMLPFAHIVKKEDAVDLPEQVHEIRDVYLDHAERTAYEQMKHEAIMELDGTVITTQAVIAAIQKMRQVTSGFAYHEIAGDDGGPERTTVQIGKSKAKALNELLEELGGNQVIIWANFKEEIKQLVETLHCPALWSGTRDTDTAIKMFQSRNAQYLVANPQTAGHGLTFVNCRYAIYYSLNYSYELWKQSMDRIHRIGQRWPCTYYYLLAKNTVDEVIYKVLQGKADLSNAVLNYLKGVA